VDWLSEPQAWIALATLTSLALVLGIDNIMLIVVLSARLPANQQAMARRIGLFLAMLLRILLLLSISWLTRLTEPLFALLGHSFSGRDLILVVGGLFLLAKGTHEIHERLESVHQSQTSARPTTFFRVLVQVAMLDVVFSLDSVITAVGMVEELGVMVTAIVLSVVAMAFLANPLAGFVEKHPTLKILAFSFLLLVGVALVADGLGHHIPRGYIYFALMFSTGVEVINLRMRHGAPGAGTH
jgi:predicted tellurium resistance membrane protein TerC